MFESELRELFERQAAADQPPPVSISAICRRGRVRLRKRRAGVIASPMLAVGAALGLTLGGVLPPVRHVAPLASAASRTAYVLTDSGTVVPVSLATGQTGRPIHAIHAGTYGGLDNIAITPDGRTLYVSGIKNPATKHAVSPVVPVDTATGAVGRPILVPSSDGFADDIMITPDGETGYALDDPAGLVPITLATGTPHRLIGITDLQSLSQLAITPDGRTIYGLEQSAGAVVPVRTATSTALRPIRLGKSFYPVCIAITPDGKTAYVGSFSPAGGAPELIPVDLTTGKVLSPIVLRNMPGLNSIAITPDGRTAYTVSDGRIVVPVSLATGRPLRPITVPGIGALFVSGMDPDGKVLYLGSPDSATVVPVSTVTNTALRPVTTPGVPAFIAFAPDGKTVYVGDDGTHLVTPIRAATGRAGRSINVGGNPAGIVFAP